MYVFACSMNQLLYASACTTLVQFHWHNEDLTLVAVLVAASLIFFYRLQVDRSKINIFHQIWQWRHSLLPPLSLTVVIWSYPENLGQSARTDLRSNVEPGPWPGKRSRPKKFSPPHGKMCLTSFKSIGHSSKKLGPSVNSSALLVSQAGYDCDTKTNPLIRANA